MDPSGSSLDHDIFFPSIVSERVKLRPHELHREYEKVLLAKLRDAVEGRCTRNGYVRRGSVRLHRVSRGALETASLNGDVVFVVQYSCDLCLPAEGSTIEAVVVNANKFGLLCHSGTRAPAREGRDSRFVPILETVVPREVVRSDIDLSLVKVGDALRLQVLGVKFRMNGPKIRVTARAMEKLGDESESARAQRKEAAARTQAAARAALRYDDSIGAAADREFDADAAADEDGGFGAQEFVRESDAIHADGEDADDGTEQDGGAAADPDEDDECAAAETGTSEADDEEDDLTEDEETDAVPPHRRNGGSASTGGMALAKRQGILRGTAANSAASSRQLPLDVDGIDGADGLDEDVPGQTDDDDSVFG